jgi:hypothetical protein
MLLLLSTKITEVSGQLVLNRLKEKRIGHGKYMAVGLLMLILTYISVSYYIQYINVKVIRHEH